MTAAATVPTRDREADILDAALAVLARDGIGGVSMRAVAREAGVSLGLANYYFAHKTLLVAAALRRIGEQDLDIVHAGPDADPAERLRRALRRIADDDFLQPDYLALRLQLWSLAAVDPSYAAINRTAQQQYLDGLTHLVAAADPDVAGIEAERRAEEILVIQNGVWLTAAILDDRGARTRAIQRCEEIAFAAAPTPPRHRRAPRDVR